jgi:phospholipid-binding lipoprotein MlaA
MLNKFVIVLITTLALTVNSLASSDGELLLKKNEPSEIKDCSEGLNRGVFAFNQGLDKVIFKPVASVYKKFPSSVKSGVSNSLDNLSNLITIPNNILQGDFGLAIENTGRLVVNTTIGILGIFDAAQHLGFSEYEKEDYGQSLAKAGMGPGCYIVLPVLGPSSVRDTAGTIANFFGGDPWYSATVINNNHYFEDSDYYYSRATQGVDFRAKNYNAIENLDKNSLDFYASVKSLYLQDRQQKIVNANQIIETQDDSDWEEITN